MDETVQKVVGFKKTTKFVYKKLPLVGTTKAERKSKYFESISEVDFKSVADKHLLRIESLKLQKQENYSDLAGVEVLTSNG